MGTKFFNFAEFLAEFEASLQKRKPRKQRRKK
jgi:hypothetical protein